MASPIIYRQTATLVGDESTVTVTLDTAFASTNYVVILEFPYQTSFWVTDKATENFVVNVGTTNAYNQTIGFIIYG